MFEGNRLLIGFRRKFVVAFSDRIVFYDDETRSNVKDRYAVF
jgi:hypothetical protein